MPEQNLTRRSVLSASAAGAGLMIVPRHVLGRGKPAPSDRLNIAAIGAGGKGRSDVEGVASEHIAALCDIDWKRAEQTVNAYPDAPRYHDYRELLDAHGDSLDAVMVSTADHTHAVMTVAALERGLHVFTQKPLTRTIWEARMVGKAARKAGTATQMGNQGHAAEGTRLIREWIDGGVIGDVDRVEYWTNRPIWPQAIKRPAEVHEVPEHVAWDLWLGPAPERPYHPEYYHPFAWRGWWDFGTGAIGDIACHAMDAAFWVFDLRDPSSVHAESTPLFKETAPASTRITFEYPARGSRNKMTVVWRDGNLTPAMPKVFEGKWPPGRSGQMFVGSEGVITADIYAGNPTIYPSKLHDKIAKNPLPQAYERTEGHYQQWIDAIKAGTTNPDGSNFADHAGPMTETALLGNLAVRSQQEIVWDPKKLKVTNGVDVPAEYIKPVFRDGWAL